MDSIHVQSSQFADMCEIPRPSFSQLLSGRNQKVSDTLIKKIHTAYPDLSVMWLMFGEGPMLTLQDNHATEETKNENKETENPSNNTITLKEDKESSDYSNLRGLSQQQNLIKDSIYQQLEENKKILELQLQIEKLQKNPRRVAQITVYYDDSTFETFLPSKNRKEV